MARQSITFRDRLFIETMHAAATASRARSEFLPQVVFGVSRYSPRVVTLEFNRVAAFVQTHDFVWSLNADGSVNIHVEYEDSDGKVSVGIETARTIEEARDILGY